MAGLHPAIASVYRGPRSALLRARKAHRQATVPGSFALRSQPMKNPLIGQEDADVLSKRRFPMFHRYTEHARQAIFRARYEATRYGTGEIDDVQLLLGVLTADEALAERLEAFGLTIARIREQFAPAQESVATGVDLPLSGLARKALLFTTEEADRVGAIEIETSHVVTALARTESSRAAEMLAASGLTPERLREILFDFSQSPQNA